MVDESSSESSSNLTVKVENWRIIHRDYLGEKENVLGRYKSQGPIVELKAPVTREIGKDREVGPSISDLGVYSCETPSGPVRLFVPGQELRSINSGAISVDSLTRYRQHSRSLLAELETSQDAREFLDVRPVDKVRNVLAANPEVLIPVDEKDEAPGIEGAGAVRSDFHVFTDVRLGDGTLASVVAMHENAAYVVRVGAADEEVYRFIDKLQFLPGGENLVIYPIVASPQRTEPEIGVILLQPRERK